MNNYKTAKSFIKEFKLNKNYSFYDLKQIANKFGYKVFEFERCKSSHEDILIAMKALELSTIKDSFTHNHKDANFICINASIPEKEKKIGLFHELLHIYKGHMSQNKSITLTQEKETTDTHFICDFILKYQIKLIIIIITLIAATNLLVLNITKSNSDTELSDSDYVYITPDGDCYHAENCSYGKKYSHSIKVSESEVEGKYLPCHYCNPDK